MFSSSCLWIDISLSISISIFIWIPGSIYNIALIFIFFRWSSTRLSSKMSLLEYIAGLIYLKIGIMQSSEYLSMCQRAQSFVRVCLLSHLWITQLLLPRSVSTSSVCRPLFGGACTFNFHCLLSVSLHTNPRLFLKSASSGFNKVGNYFSVQEFSKLLPPNLSFYKSKVNVAKKQS